MMDLVVCVGVVARSVFTGGSIIAIYHGDLRALWRVEDSGRDILVVQFDRS